MKLFSSAINSSIIIRVWVLRLLFISVPLIARLCSAFCHHGFFFFIFCCCCCLWHRCGRLLLGRWLLICSWRSNWNTGCRNGSRLLLVVSRLMVINSSDAEADVVPVMLTVVASFFPLFLSPSFTLHNSLLPLTLTTEQSHHLHRFYLSCSIISFIRLLVWLLCLISN